MKNVSESALKEIRDLVASNPVPDSLSKHIDMAWAVYRQGKIPENYLICSQAVFEKISKLLGFYPAHINIGNRGVKYVSFSLAEIRR